jgi:hypothetical protein
VAATVWLSYCATTPTGGALRFDPSSEHALETGAIPESIKVPVSLPDPTGAKAVCVWEADAVKPVQDFIDGLFGAVSDNEYFEVAAQKAIGLPG